METITPYVEGSDDFVESFEGFESRLHVDIRTGHGSFRPVPPASVLERYYNGDFIRGGQSTPQSEYTPQVDVVIRGIYDHLLAVTGLSPAFSLHDVGCAYGAAVRAFQRLGVKATGNELNRAWVEAANPFCCGALSSEPLAAALAALSYRVDTFLCCHVLEHTPDPLAEIATMESHLSRDGVLYLCVPNSHSLSAMIGGRRADYGYSFPMHLNYFSPLSMLETVEAVGLEVAHLETHAMGETFRPAENVAAWEAGLNAQLLGGELFMLVTRPENRATQRSAGIRARCQQAATAFMTMRPGELSRIGTTKAG